MSKKFIIETSARHVHVTQEHLEILFGKGATLTKKKDLSQPGQYACEERVTIVGSKKELANVSILGPVRPSTQVELSATDARSIGIAAPVRESGDIAQSGACKIVGPCGEVEINEGVIVAKRHIHLTPEDAQELGVADKEVVWVLCETDGRKAILGDVVCRVSEKFARAMHIDTDESNAIGAGRSLEGEIVKINL
ncbi:MAG: phosphate propanoyltransferase [Oscillospiraceae bacterium]|nr:phosphate propanoyltransferase [Oscillospiraceae bacterium]